MNAIHVWTKQHSSVWDTLEKTGRYTARREFIRKDLQETPAWCWRSTIGWSATGPTG